MMKKSILLIVIWGMIFSLPAPDLRADAYKSTDANGQKKVNSPFLITDNLPHLTKLLMQQWDNPALLLSAAQKTKLLVIRKETIASVQKLTPEITHLERQVTEGIFDGKIPAELHSLVKAIAELKAEATMVHLRCVYDTSEILDQQQLEVLIKF
jgi:hypothetical protein